MEAVQSKVLEIANQNQERQQVLEEELKSIQTQASEIAQQNHKRQEELERKMDQVHDYSWMNRILGIASVVELIIVILLLWRMMVR